MSDSGLESEAEASTFFAEAKEGGRRKRESIIPRSRLKEWFGHERLPDGWWDDVRPSREVGLLEAGKCAKAVGVLS